MHQSIRSDRSESRPGIPKSARNGYTSLADSDIDAACAAAGPFHEPEPALTDEMLGVVPMQNLVLFPGVVREITIDRWESIVAVQGSLRESRRLGLLLRREAAVIDTGPGDLHEVGTVVRVLCCGRDTDESQLLTCRGEARFRVVEFTARYPYLVARIERPKDVLTDKGEIRNRVLALKKRISKAVALLPEIPAELAVSIQSIESPGALSDLIAGLLDIPSVEKQKLLEMFDVRQRLEAVADCVARRVETIEPDTCPSGF